VVGFLAMPIINLVGERLSVIVGIVSLFCIAFLTLEKFVFK
jgi:hypothetical protein